MKFEAEVISWLPQLRRYARALTGDTAWADDLVQDTAERALARWAAFRPNSNLRAWLLTILRHLYIDQLRVRREVTVDEESAPWRDLVAPPGEVDGLVLRDLQRALYRLPIEQREVLLLVLPPPDESAVVQAVVPKAVSASATMTHAVETSWDNFICSLLTTPALDPAPVCGRMPGCCGVSCVELPRDGRSGP